LTGAIDRLGERLDRFTAAALQAKKLDHSFIADIAMRSVFAVALVLAALAAIWLIGYRRYAWKMRLGM
jgi:hypothetical protein